MKGRLTFGAVVGLVVIGTVSANADRAHSGAERERHGGTPSVSAGQHPGATSGRTGGDGSALRTPRAKATR
ncbi:hypothetical protein ABZ876_10240 [Streptomyces sp. NPDC046931]|uniref:hypothetical protein n=1 Tax=Streptomyces sp. NPDC046931 TaxID=3154806 RepID=UPI0033FD654A